MIRKIYTFYMNYDRNEKNIQETNDCSIQLYDCCNFYFQTI